MPFEADSSALPIVDKDGDSITDDNPLTLADVLVRQIERDDPVLGLPVSGLLRTFQDSPTDWSLFGLFLRDIFLSQQIADYEFVLPVASTTEAGLALIATLAKGRGGTDDEAIMTSLKVLDQLRNGSNVQATTSRRGVAELANESESRGGEDDERLITAEGIVELFNELTSAPVWQTLVDRSVAYNTSFVLDLNDLVVGVPTPSILVSGLQSGFSESDGVISGQSTVQGTEEITVTATNVRGSASEMFDLTVEEAPGTLPVWSGITDLTYDAQATVSFDLNDHVTGDPTPTVSVSGLPTGLSESDGVVSGSSVDIGTHTVTATATNSIGSVQIEFDVVIVRVAPRYSVSGFEVVGQEGEAVHVDFVPTIGTPPFTFSYTGSFPSTVTFNSATGQLTGTHPGDSNLEANVTATNDAGSDTVQIGWDEDS